MRAGESRPRQRPRSVVVASLAALALLLGAAVLPAPGASAQDDFPTGDAQASADSFTLAMTAANATIGFTFGRSIAQFQDRTGAAQARALDLGGLPALFGMEQCDGSPPLLPAETLPPLTRADSTNPGSEVSRRTEVRQPGLSGGPVGDVVGYQDAVATPLPSSRATTETVPIDLFVVAIEGARTEVSTKRQGRVREATAVSTADVLRVAGGLFTFTKPRWEAVTRSGDDTTTTAAFTFERATVLGQERTAEEAMDDLANFKAFLDALLAPLGVTFQLPTVEPREGGIRVTPMGFRIANPPIGTDFLIPVLGQVDPFVQGLRTILVELDCKNQTLLTVVDVLLGVMGGSGTIELMAGGVDVTTSDTDYTLPPIEELPPPGPDVGGEITEVAGATDQFGDLGLSDLGDFGFEDFGDLDEFGAAPFGEAALEAVPLEETAAGARRRTSQTPLPPVTLTSYEDTSAGRAAVAVGVVALLGAVGLSMADRLVGRRAKRRIL